MALNGAGGPPPTRFKRTDSDSGLRICIALASISLIIFTMSVREPADSGFFNALRGGWMTITTPFRFVGSAMVKPFEGLGNVMYNLTADQEDLTALREENERLVARNAELEEAEQTAARLERLLGLQSVYNLQSTAARVISGSTDSWTTSVIIDKGTSSGLAVGMPVTDSNGAIGQIIECGLTTSTVRLLADENSSVSAMVQGSRAQGILRGSADGALRLTLVRSDQVVEEGDTVVTSGLGGVYPKGLPLGKVLSVERSASSLYYTIEVEMLSTTEAFEEVLVITSLSDDQKATEEEVREAEEQDGAADAAPETDGEEESASDGTDDASDEAIADAAFDEESQQEVTSDQASDDTPAQNEAQEGKKDATQDEAAEGEVD